MTNLVRYLSSIMIVLVFFFSYSIFIKNKKSNIDKKEALVVEHGKIKKKLLDNSIKIPYILILLISIILGFCSASLKNYWSEDYWSYDRGVYNYYFTYEIDKTDTLNTLADKNIDMEAGYLLLNTFLLNFTNNSFWLFFIITFIFTFINFYVICNLTNKDYKLILLLFSSLFFIYSFYLIRQALAVSFINLAFLSFYRDKKLRFLFFGIISCLFHISAIIIFILLIVDKIKSKRSYIYALLITTVLLLNYEKLLNIIFTKISFLNQYTQYATDNLDDIAAYGRFTAIIRGFPFYLLLFLALYNYDILIHRIKKAHILIFCVFMCAFGWILSYKMHWFYRISWYFMLPAFIVAPAIIDTINNTLLQRLYFLLVILSLAILSYRDILGLFL